MSVALHFAALLLAFVGVAHSYLGERYVLIRLFRRQDLPKLLGSDEFTKRVLRFAWHLTSVAWLGLAAILVLIARQALDARSAGIVVGATFLIHFAIALVGSRGRHLSWPFFLAIGLLTLWATVG